MLELKNISWTAPDGAEILTDISLTIPERKVVVITGPNGGGKTTVAKLIAGILIPTSGQIIFDGRDITSLGVSERAKLGLSYAFQQPVRFKGLTVRDLIELASGGSLSEIAACDILSEVGLCAREYIDREVDATLSGGEIKRIEIASVIARHTKMTVFDEPEAGIDLWSFSSLIEAFKRMQNALDGSLVVISHQQRIMEIADLIAVISDGTVEGFGARDEILPTLLNGGRCCVECNKPRRCAQ